MTTRTEPTLSHTLTRLALDATKLGLLLTAAFAGCAGYWTAAEVCGAAAVLLWMAS